MATVPLVSEQEGQGVVPQDNVFPKMCPKMDMAASPGLQQKWLVVGAGVKGQIVMLPFPEVRLASRSFWVPLGSRRWASGNAWFIIMHEAWISKLVYT